MLNINCKIICFQKRDWVWVSNKRTEELGWEFEADKPGVRNQDQRPPQNGANVGRGGKLIIPLTKLLLVLCNYHRVNFSTHFV